jgi:hypothetical protein
VGLDCSTDILLMVLWLSRYVLFVTVSFPHYRTEEALYFTCSYFNVQEVEVIVHYVERLFTDRFSGRKLKQEDIGVITPYRKQVSL